MVSSDRNDEVKDEILKLIPNAHISFHEENGTEGASFFEILTTLAGHDHILYTHSKACSFHWDHKDRIAAKTVALDFINTLGTTEPVPGKTIWVQEYRGFPNINFWIADFEKVKQRVSDWPIEKLGTVSVHFIPKFAFDKNDIIVLRPGNSGVL